MVDYATPYLLDLLIVRHLEESDLPALEWGGEYQHFRRLYREIYSDMCQGKALMWVCDLVDEGVIGQVFVQLAGARTELADGRNRAYVFAFRVKPSFRGLGIGTRLLKVIEADLIKRQFQWVNLNVSRENQEAQRFYERHGYRIIAPEPGRWSYLDDQGQRRFVHEPAWRMGKKLPGG